MNRTPSSRPSPPVGEKVPERRLRGIPKRFMVPKLDSGIVEATHELGGARLLRALIASGS